MNWLNIEIIRTQGPEYTSAEPLQQLAWFHLLLYCAQQENGGIIHNATSFTDRQWSRLIDVDASTLRSPCPLWDWLPDGALTVWQYPAAQEEVVRAKREGGRKGGQSKPKPSSTPSSTPSTKEKKEQEEELEQEPERGSQGNPTAPPMATPEGSDWLDDFEIPEPEPKAETPAPPEPKPKRTAPAADPEAIAVTLPDTASAELREAWTEWQEYRQSRASAKLAADRIPWTGNAARTAAKQFVEHAARLGDWIVCNRVASAISGHYRGLNLHDIATPKPHKPHF